MLFKPNFCCNCGVKIERAEWSMLTSRRFCEVCAVEKKGHDWLPRVVVIAGVLLGVFGLGSFVGGPGRNEPALIRPGQNDSAERLTTGAVQRSGINKEEGFDPSNRTSPGTATMGLSHGAGGPDVTKEQPRLSAAASDEPVHFCGAMTKKGKPCSRRVRSKGRCWQHAGQPSALVSQSARDVY